jgi:hypothetical protein
MLAGEVPFKGSSIPSIMKKHLTLPPPSFQSMGIAVPPPIESVVRHALEKEVEARIESIPAFLRDLHAAVNAAPAIASGLRETVAMDPNQTVASIAQPPANNLSATSTQPPIAQETNFGASFNSLAGVRDEGGGLRKEKEERERKEREQQDKLDRCRRRSSKTGSNDYQAACRPRSILKPRTCREVPPIRNGLPRAARHRQLRQQSDRASR